MQILLSKLFRLFLNKQIIHPPHPLQSEARTDYVGTLLEFRAQLSTESHCVLCKQSKRKFLPHRASNIKKTYHRDHRKLETEMRQLQTRASRTEFNFFKFMSVHFSQTFSKRDEVDLSRWTNPVLWKSIWKSHADIVPQLKKHDPQKHF